MRYICCSSARGSRRRPLLLLLSAACSLLAAVGCLLASCFSVHQRWTASRLRTPIMYPLCITSNFSNFSHFLSSSLLACQQLPREGHGHFDRSGAACGLVERPCYYALPIYCAYELARAIVQFLAPFMRRTLRSRWLLVSEPSRWLAMCEPPVDPLLLRARGSPCRWS